MGNIFSGEPIFDKALLPLTYEELIEYTQKKNSLGTK